MHFQSLLLLASGALAFTIPEGQANGVYEVSYDADGVEKHTRLHGLADLPPTIESRSPNNRPPAARQIGNGANAISAFPIFPFLFTFHLYLILALPLANKA
jgi:hypothetical protein